MAKKVSPACQFESNVISSVIRAAIGGLGFTILPRAYVKTELSSKRLVQMNPKPLWQHKMILLGLRSRIDQTRKQFAEYFVSELA